MDKSFLEQAYITTEETPATETKRLLTSKQKAREVRKAQKILPDGYCVRPEARKRRVALYVNDATFEALKDKAESTGLSVNELINRAIEGIL